MSQQDEGVEGLKKKLYSRSNQGDMRDVRTPLTPDTTDTPKAWADSKPSLPEGPNHDPMLQTAHRKRLSFAAKFFIGSVVFFVVAASAAAFFFLNGTNFISPNNIDMQIVAPSLVDGGSTVTFQYLITNRNAAQLQLADLVITYPDGTRSAADPTKGATSERQSIGTIQPGQQFKRTSSAILYGAEGATEVVHASLEYSLAGSNAVFTKDADITITIGSSPVSISVDAPQEAIAGEPFDVTLTVRNNQTTAVDNVVVQAQYPFGFSALTTSPKADAGGSYWRLGSMGPGASQTIVVHGSLDGQDGDQRVFKFLSGSDNDPTDTSIATPFLTVPTTLTVHKPFISGSIAIGGQTGKVVSVAAGSVVQGEIDWQNNLTTSVSDVEITLSLTGPVLDQNSVDAGNGFYQSANNTITWTSQQDPSLASVGPGGTGKLTFNFGTLPPGASGSLYSNPTVNLSLNVKGTRTGETGVPEVVSSVTQTQVSLASAATLAAKALHFIGPYQNTGPMPPRAEQQTTYTIQWTVKNSSNIIANTAVTAVLPPYVNFVAGQTGVAYDPASRTVRWAIGDLKPGVGYTSTALSTNFQVALNPSLSQVSGVPTLTGVAQLTGTDRFAQVPVNTTAEALTTKLTSDPQFVSGMDIVAPKQ